MRVMARATQVVVFLLFLLSGPVEAQGQEEGPQRDHSGRLGGGIYLAIGNSPSPLAEYGVRVLYTLPSPLGFYADAHWLDSGVGGGCAQSWPASYACSLRARSFGAGATFEPRRGKAVGPVLEAGLGVLDRTDRVVEGGAALGMSAAAGIRIDPTGRLSLKGFARHAWVRDRTYEELMGRTLNHWVLGLALELNLSGQSQR